MLSPLSWAQQWFTVASPRDTVSPVVEIDLDTVRFHGGTGEGVIRVSADALQQHPAGFTYRSFVAAAHFDCIRQGISLGSAAYFALPPAQGTPLGTEDSGRTADTTPNLIASIPIAARQALLKAMCATAHAN